MRLLLYAHGGSGNHGCEAIVRSTVEMTGTDTILASSSPEEDLRYGLDQCCHIIKEVSPINKWSFDYVKASFHHHVLGDNEAFDKCAFRPLFDAAKDCDAALSIGGDNYCYGENKHLYCINRELRKRGIKTVLWGCSITPGAIQGELLDDLHGYSGIFARESISYEALITKGLTSVELFPDPAFALSRKNTPLPEGFIEGNTVGINISPMVCRYESRTGMVLSNVQKLIKHILHDTEMSVALIPHVIRPNDDDRTPLMKLYNLFQDSCRIVLVEDRPAEELKDLIARCRYMVAARTHASIAAYSTQIPTLVIGYSVKSEGIAKDIFGESRPFVIPVQTLERDATLSSEFDALREKEGELKYHFQRTMPGYCESVNNHITALTQIING